MRLTLKQLAVIKKNTLSVYGEQSKVYLFGSRIDDTKNGGDIDLYIVPEHQHNWFEKKLSLLTALTINLGEQKIDLIIAQDNNRWIEKEAILKGVELDLEQIKRNKIIKECDKHLQRINEAYNDMAEFMLLDSNKYETLSKNQVQVIDQYLFRFTKLQDAMGEKLFKLCLHKFEENVDKLPFLDILNKLEKYLDIRLTDEWQNLRKVRNQLAHEYEDDAIEMSNMINLIYAKKIVIERIYCIIKIAIS